MGGQLFALATFPWEKDLVPIVQEAGWAAELVWTGAENLTPNGIRSLTVQLIASHCTN